MKRHLLTVAVLVGSFAVNAAVALTFHSDSQVTQYAKRRPAPPQPEPDHGPTLPPDPWTPI